MKSSTCGHLLIKYDDDDDDLTIRVQKAQRGAAVLYYTSWWDFGGIEFEIGGIDPNCRHPKP